MAGTTGTDADSDEAGVDAGVDTSTISDEAGVVAGFDDTTAAEEDSGVTETGLDFR